MAMMSSGLQRPNRSIKLPNSGDEITASSMGSVLMKPDIVGSMPWTCIQVGPNDRTASSTMLNAKNASRNSKKLGLSSSA